jgi:hypothetical protein
MKYSVASKKASVADSFNIYILLFNTISKVKAIE